MIPGEPQFNPFPGLRPFEMGEEYLFFGREQQQQELVSLLREQRFLTVIGSSGSGKSSLVRAGLLPALYGGVMTKAGSHWHIGVMRPGSSPLTNLAGALFETELMDNEECEDLTELDLEATLIRSGLGLIEAARQSGLKKNENLLIVVDQFEELFRFGSSQSERGTRDEAAAFIKLLVEASRQEDLSIYVVLTMRSDFFGDCSNFEDLAQAVNRGEYLVPRLNREQKKTAIKGPVKVGGGDISPRLMQRLLNDLGDDPDQLPILQHALMRTWDYWLQHRRENEPLDLRHYEAVGTMAMALSQHADEVFEEAATEEEEEASRRMFQALTEKGGDNRGIRRPTRLAELAGISGVDEETLTGIIDRFRKQGCTFLMPPEGVELQPETVIDISHESLMRVWERLKQWVEEEAQSARIYQRLAETARMWKAEEAGLYRDPDLTIGLNWRDESEPNEAWATRYHPGYQTAIDFLEQSDEAHRAEMAAAEAARQRELDQARKLAEAEKQRAETQTRAVGKMRRLVAALAILVLGAGGAAYMAFVARQEARSSAVTARANETAARKSKKQADINAQLAETQRQAAQTAQSQAEKAALNLQNTLARNHFVAGVERLDTGKTSEGLAHLARALRVNREYSQAAIRMMSEMSSRTFDLDTRPVLKHAKPIQEPVLNNQGDLVLTHALGGKAKVWETASGRELAAFPPSAKLSKTSFFPDGETVYTRDEDDTCRLWEARTGKPLSPEIRIPDSKIQFIITGQEKTSPVARWIIKDQKRRCHLYDQRGKVVASPLEIESGVTIGAIGFFNNYRDIFSLCSDKTVRLWEAATGKPKGKPLPVPIDHFGDKKLGATKRKGNVNRAVVYSLDKTRYAFYKIDDQLVQTGLVTLQKPIGKHYWSPDSRYMTLIEDGDRPSLHTYDMETGKMVGQTINLSRVQNPKIKYFLHAGSGTLVVIGFMNKGLASYDLDAGVSRRGPVLDYEVKNIVFSPDGGRIAVSFDNLTCQVFDVKTMQPESASIDLTDYMSKPLSFSKGVSFSPEGERLVVMGNRKGRMFNARTGLALTEEFKLRRGGDLVGFCDEGNSVLIHEKSWTRTERGSFLTYGAARLINIRDTAVRQQPLARVEGYSTGKMIPGTSHILLYPYSSSDSNTDTLLVMDVLTGQVVRELETIAPIDRLEVSPDGRRVMVASAQWVHVQDLSTGKILRKLRHDTPVRRGSFCPDGQRLVTYGKEPEAYLWNLETGQSIGGLLKNSEGIIQMPADHFSPDGRLLVIRGTDNAARIWDARTGELRHTLRHDGLLTAAKFSHQGGELFIATSTGIIRRWDCATGKELGKFNHGKWIRALDISSDDKLLLATGGANPEQADVVETWDLETGQLISTTDLAVGALYSAHFVGVNRAILTCDAKSNLDLWDMHTGKRLMPSTYYRGNAQEIPMLNLDEVSYVMDVRPSGVWRHQLVTSTDAVAPWLPQLAEVAGGMRLTETGGKESVGIDQLADVRTALNNDPDTAGSYAHWATWFLANPGARSIAPSVDATMRAHQKFLVLQNTKESFAEGLRMFPGQGEMHALMAQKAATETRTGGYQSPMEWYQEKAKELAPNSAITWSTHARNEFIIGRHPNVVAANVGKALELDSNNTEAWYWKASHENRMKRDSYPAMQRAVELALELSESDRHPAEFALNLALAPLLEISPGDTEALLEHAYSLLMVEKSDHTIAEWRIYWVRAILRYIEKKELPMDGRSWRLKAKIHHTLKDPIDVIGMLTQKALDADPKHGEAWRLRGIHLIIAGKPKDAIEVLTKGLELADRHPGPLASRWHRNILIVRAEAKSRLGDKAGADLDRLFANIPARDSYAKQYHVPLDNHYNRRLMPGFDSKLGLGKQGLVVFDVRGRVEIPMGVLGVEMSKEGRENGGVTVALVVPGSPAQKAGLRPGDIIYAFNKKEILASEKLAATVRNHPGEKVVLSIIRGEKKQDIEVTLGPIGEASSRNILVNQKGRYLDFLHATFVGGANGQIVATYRVHYGEGEPVDIPIRYGQHLRRFFWVAKTEPEEVSQARIVCRTRHTDSGKSINLRLFHYRWINPHPERVVTHIDLLPGNSTSKPFLAGLTVSP